MWTFLDEARDQSLIVPGEMVVAGSTLTPAVCQVVDVVAKPAGTIVHLRPLPGTIDQYRRLGLRLGASPATRRHTSPTGQGIFGSIPRGPRPPLPPTPATLSSGHR